MSASRHRAIVFGMQGLVFAVLANGGIESSSQTPSSRGGLIYTCVDDKGTPLRRDRFIVECTHKEQRILNPDGSLKQVLPATLTPEQRVEREAAERKAAEEKAAQNEAVKSDLYLKKRYPNEAAHNRKREADLEPVRQAMRNSEARLLDLAAERKPLMQEAEFYEGKTMPAWLKQQIEGIDAAVAAQREAIRTQEAELVRINKNFDVELDRLRRLLKGAQPGPVGPASR
jgi:hypothetical protein